MNRIIDPDTIQVRIYNDVMWQGYRMFVRKPNHHGIITFEEHKDDEGARYEPPSIMLDKTEAQILMDDLWSSGIRPSEGSGSAGSLKATESHLNDMRKIAFKQLKMEVK